jgi:polyisoprenoid-binding protein YceI
MKQETSMTTTTKPTTKPTTKAADGAGIEKTRWRIDPARSSIEFRTPTFWGLVTVKGRFERYDGTLDLRREPAIDLKIAADSLDTKNKMRDKHLRAVDFFDVKQHPTVRFVSDVAKLEGERLIVRGQLHAGGDSMPIDLEARLRRVGDELEVDTTTYVDQRELGMAHSPLGMIRAPTELIVHGRLVRDQGGEG